MLILQPRFSRVFTDILLFYNDLIGLPRSCGGWEGGGVIPYFGYTGGRAAGQCMVFWPRCPGQGRQFHSPLS